MTYYINSRNRRKKNIFLIVVITITLIGFIATAALLGGFFCVNKMIGEDLIKVTTIKESNVSLNKGLEDSKGNLQTYEKKLRVLNEELLRFEAVIIPDSMLKDKEKKQ